MHKYIVKDQELVTQVVTFHVIRNLSVDLWCLQNTKSYSYMTQLIAVGWHWHWFATASSWEAGSIGSQHLPDVSLSDTAYLFSRQYSLQSSILVSDNPLLQKCWINNWTVIFAFRSKSHGRKQASTSIEDQILESS